MNICESNADDLIKKKVATETFLWPWFLFSAFVFCSFPTILRSIATELIHYVTKKEAGRETQLRLLACNKVGRVSEFY